jgi:outer membrane receptor protein involved in Fe transport
VIKNNKLKIFREIKDCNMSFTRNIIKLSILTALGFYSPILLANTVADNELASIEVDSEEISSEETLDGDPEDSLEDFYGDEDFVSIATGSKQLIHKAPSTASVITAEEITRMGAVDIDEVLESVAGLHVSYKTGNNLPIYTFRGIYSAFNQQVLMLINGVPITNLFMGNRNQVWGGMTVEAIARIEVVRGPGSAVYGADALSGVINIITKSSKTMQGSEAGYRAGSFATRDYWFTHGWKKGDLGGFISFARHETDGFEQFIEADAQTFLDSVFGTKASLAPGFADPRRKNDEFRLSLDYRKLIFNMGYQKRRIDVGLGIGEALGPGSDESSDRWNADLSYTSNEIIEGWEFSAKFSYFSTTQEINTNLIIFPPGSDIGLGGPFPDGLIGNPEVFERYYRTGVVARYNLITDHALTVGTGYDISDLYKVQESKNFAFGPNGEYLPPGSPVVDVTDTPFVFLPEDNRKNSYLYVQDIWQVAKDWELTSGIRYDNYSDFGTTINPRLALVWTASLNLTTKFLYGSAFRAPSFAEMRNINNPTTIGNPDLTPESIDSYELVFNYHPYSGINYGVSFFRYDWQNIVQFVPDEGATTKTAQNIGEQQGYGFELEFSWQLLDKLNLSGNYSWVNAEDTNKNKVDAIPEKQLYLRVYYEITENLGTSIKTNWVLDRVRAVDDLRKPIDNYNLTDLAITWKPQQTNISVSLIVKNIFDTDAREPTANKGPVVNVPNDLPLPGRTTLAQVSYSF